MNKKVLFVFRGLQFHIDEGAKLRLYSMIDSYKKNGYDVDVLVYFPAQLLKYLFTYKKYLRADVNWMLFPHIPVTVNKCLNVLSRWFSSCVYMAVSRLRHYDIIQSEGQGNFCVCTPKHSKLVVDFHGDSYDEFLLSRPARKSFANLLLKDMKGSLDKADHVIFVSENLKLQFEKYFGKPINNYSIISCGVDLSRFVRGDVREKSPYKDKIVLGYLGGLQKWQCIGTIMDIVISLREKCSDIFFVLYTNFKIPEHLMNKLEQIGVENYVVKSLSFDMVADNLPLLDAGFLIRENLVLNVVSSPTKILEYLAAGVPIICNCYSGDYSRSVEHGKNGFIFNGFAPTEEEKVELLKYLKKVKTNRLEYAMKCRYSVNDREFSSEFTSFVSKMN